LPFGCILNLLLETLRRTMLVAIVAAGIAFCASAEDPHDHGAANFEWAGIFETSSTLYMWTAQKVEGAYADASMKLAALPVSGASEEELHQLESEGIHALEEVCTDVYTGDTILPEMDKCYTLHFNQNMWQSLFKVDASSTSAIAFFTEHVPTEFEATAHYLKDATGEDIEPVAELPEESPAAETSEEKPWGPVIGAALIVQLMTLVGIILAVPGIKKLGDTYPAELMGVFSGFAAGALLACAFFLLLFEATHLVGTGWDEEVDVLWRWGTMILVGFTVPGLVDVAVAYTRDLTASQISPVVELGDNAAVVVCVGAPKADSAPKAESAAAASSKARLFAGVIIGDFFHNLCDGFFLGAAFKGCGDSFGWGVALGTVLHEIPQELADYVLLTGPGIGLSSITALLWNFLSGLSIFLGAIMVLSAEISDSSTGLLLSFGGGVYLHIAATECMPRIYDERLSLTFRVASMVAFIVGAVLIGLVLLDHEHCVPASTEGGGGGGHHH
jgi:UTP--glucose-1-phosphate uridylyltransferase